MRKFRVWLFLDRGLLFWWNHICFWFHSLYFCNIALPHFSSFDSLTKFVKDSPKKERRLLRLTKFVYPKRFYLDTLGRVRAHISADDANLFVTKLIEKMSKSSVAPYVRVVRLLICTWKQGDVSRTRSACIFSYLPIPEDSEGTVLVDKEVDIKWGFYSHNISNRVDWGFDSKEEIVKRIIGAHLSKDRREIRWVLVSADLDVWDYFSVC